MCGIRQMNEWAYTKIVCLTLAYSFTLRYLQTDTDEQATHTQKVQQTQSEAKAADGPADPSASCVPLS